MRNPLQKGLITQEKGFHSLMTQVTQTVAISCSLMEARGRNPTQEVRLSASKEIMLRIFQIEERHHSKTEENKTTAHSAQ